MSRLSNLNLAAALAVALLTQAAAPAPAAAGGIQTDGQIVSTVPPGTPPLQVASPDPVENLNADLLDGYDAGSFRFAREVRVGKSGTGDFQTIQEAIDSVSTQSRPALIRLGPGTYNERVVLPREVHLRGAGKGLTVLRHTGADAFDATAAALVLGSRSRVSDLSVSISTHDYNYAVGIHNPDGNVAEIEDVEIRVFTAKVASTGIANGDSATLSVNESRLVASGNDDTLFTFGIFNQGSLFVRRSFIWANGGENAGVSNSGTGSTKRVLIEYSTIEASPPVQDDDEFNTELRFSTIYGPVAPSVRCKAVVGANRFHADTCSE